MIKLITYKITQFMVQDVQFFLKLKLLHTKRSNTNILVRGLVETVGKWCDAMALHGVINRLLFIVPWWRCNGTYDVNPLDSKGNYSATSNNTKLVHWPLMGGLLHLVQRGGDWAGPQPAQTPPRCTKCNNPPVNGQCTNHCIAMWWSVALRF